MRPILITGGESTATSSATMLINSDPRALILFEAPLTGDRLSRGARAFISRFPDSRRFFTRYVSPAEAYEDFRTWLATQGFEFQRIGIKQPSLDPQFLDLHREADIVYCVRDIRTWLPQPRVLDRYAARANIVPAATAYIHQLILSTQASRCFRFRTEDYARDPATVATPLGDFLGLTLDASAPWQATLALAQDHPKTATDWWTYHQSSLTHQGRIDTTVTLRPHRFWDDVLPLFDRYYSAAASQKPALDSAESDLQHLERIGRTYSVRPSDAYVMIDKNPINVLPAAPRWRRVGYHLKRALRAAVCGS